MAEYGMTTIDYVVFIGTVALATLIGIYYAIKDRQNKGIENYQFGNGEMSPIAIGLSLAMSIVSSTTLIGYRSDLYLYGTVMFWYSFVALIPCALACVYYIPLIFKLNLQTINQVLETRFNRKVRKFSSLYSLIGMFLVYTFNLYLPPLALAALTPLSLNLSILLTGAMVTLYTTLGGMKAVVWTDVIQTLIMLLGTIAVFVRTIIVIGGFEEMWKSLDKSGRLNHWDFNLDPTFQRTFWTICIGQSFSRIGVFCVSQPFVQRYLSCKSVKEARIAAAVSVIPFIGFSLFCILLGCAAYTYFDACDPLLNNEIQKYDQMIPLLVSEIFQDVPGMTGLFVAAVYSGALSSLSSGINSCGTMIVQDFIIPFFPNLGQTFKTTISKITSMFVGVVITGIAFVYQLLGGTVITLTFTLVGCTAGPTLGLFTLALFLPWTNALGAVGGTLIGLAINLWISISAMIHGIPPDKLRAFSGSIDGCNVSNESTSSTGLLTSSIQSFTSFSSSFTKTTSDHQKKPDLYYTLYAMSFEYYVILGCLVTVVVGLFISFITKPNKPSDLDPRLFVPFIDSKYLPKRVRKFFRFGVPDEDDSLIKQGTSFKVAAESETTPNYTATEEKEDKELCEITTKF